VTSYRLDDLAQRVGGEVRGDPERLLRGIAALEQAGPHDLSFLTNSRYRKAAVESGAGAILVGTGIELAGCDLLQAAEPYVALAQLLGLFHPPRPQQAGISPDARIGQDVRLGRDVRVGPFAVVGDRCELGDRAVVDAACVLGEACRVGCDTRLSPRVVLYDDTHVGARCIVHAGVVLGGDGFGFATSAGKHRKVPQVGRVVVEDDVEIGANSCVDRAMLGHTLIGRGSKIDDLVMIAHGVQLGPDSLLAGQAGVAGSASLGARATLAGQAGVAGHLKLGEGVTVAAKSAVFQDLAAGAFVAGVPAADHAVWKRSQALFRRLPELRNQLRELRTRLAALEDRLQRED
jgi:UDP-3-O-[3-hydroxymyristoyl] glucosamine N-acyltransferase